MVKFIKNRCFCFGLIFWFFFRSYFWQLFVLFYNLYYTYIFCSGCIVLIKLGDFFDRQYYVALNNTKDDFDAALESAKEQFLNQFFLKIRYGKWLWSIVVIFMLSVIVIVVLRRKEMSGIEKQESLTRQILIDSISTKIEDKVSRIMVNKFDALIDMTNQQFDSIQTSINKVIEQNNKVSN